MWASRIKIIRRMNMGVYPSLSTHKHTYRLLLTLVQINELHTIRGGATTKAMKSQKFSVLASLHNMTKQADVVSHFALVIKAFDKWIILNFQMSTNFHAVGFW